MRSRRRSGIGVTPPTWLMKLIYFKRCWWRRMLDAMALGHLPKIIRPLSSRTWLRINPTPMCLIYDWARSIVFKACESRSHVNHIVTYTSLARSVSSLVALRRYYANFASFGSPQTFPFIFSYLSCQKVPFYNWNQFSRPLFMWLSWNWMRYTFLGDLIWPLLKLIVKRKRV